MSRKKFLGSRAKSKNSQSNVDLSSTHVIKEKRMLYFHTGTHKTGSTALQGFLAANSDRLASMGVAYRFLEGADETFGNGQPLYEAVYGRQLADQLIDNLLNSYLAGDTVGLCSSEDFTRFGHDEWMQIRDACIRNGISINTICFIRNIGPYYRSLHGQMVKGGDIFSSPDEFYLNNQYFPVVNSLRIQCEIIGHESMTVSHYESCINSLEKPMLQALGLPEDSFDRAPLLKRVNRSLTNYEQSILTTINKAVGKQYSYELSDLLMKQWPNLIEQKAINPRTIEELEKRHNADLRWINGTFFAGKDVLKVQETIHIQADSDAFIDVLGIDKIVTEWALTKLQQAQDSSIDYVTSRLLAIDWSNARDGSIPDDFDPIAYLLLNSDVLKAGVPPYEHFIISGRHEPGRLWRWPV